MAVETFYILNSVASGSNHLGLQRNGTAPTVATTATGWTVGTTVATRYALLDALTERIASTFGATALPNAAPNNTLGDSLRTPLPLSGTFAAGTWTITLGFIAVNNGGTQDGRIRIDVWRSTNATGSGATKLNTTTPLTSAAIITNLATATAQLQTVTWAAPIVTLANEYLFFQIAWHITGAATNASADVLLRIGNVSPSQSRVVTPIFTETLTRTVTATATIKTTGARTVSATASISLPALSRTVPATASIETPIAPFVMRRSLMRGGDQLRYGATGAKAVTVPVTASIKVTNTRTATATATIKTTPSRTVPATASIYVLTTATRTVPATAVISGVTARSIPATAAIAAVELRTIEATASISTPAAERERTVPAVAAIDRQGVATSFDYWNRRGPLLLLRGLEVTTSFDFVSRAEPTTVLLGSAVNRFGRQVPATATIWTPGVTRIVPARASIYLRSRASSFDYHSARSSPLPYLVGRHATTSFDFAIRGEPARALILGLVDRYQRTVPASAVLLVPNERNVPAEAAIIIQGPILIDPLDETVSSPVTLVWRGRTVSPTGTAHARVAFALGHDATINPDGSFGTLESQISSSTLGDAYDFEVDTSVGDDGTGPWVAFPETGIDADQQARQQRVTVALASGPWSWMVRLESVVLS